jgi:carbon starvation protein
VWLLICTLSAGWLKAFSADPAIGFLAHARKFGEAIAAGTVLGPAHSLGEMQRIVFNDHLNAALCCAFMAVVVAIAVIGVVGIRRALINPHATTHETPDVPAMAEAAGHA